MSYSRWRWSVRMGDGIGGTHLTVGDHGHGMGERRSLWSDVMIVDGSSSGSWPSPSSSSSRAVVVIFIVLVYCIAVAGDDASSLVIVVVASSRALVVGPTAWSPCFSLNPFI